MPKYDALSDYLKSVGSMEWRASFSDIEKILKFRLPASAHSYAAWWSNQADGGHSQSAAWQGAGFRTGSLDLKGKKISFTREGAAGTAPKPAPAPSPASHAAKAPKPAKTSKSAKGAKPTVRIESPAPVAASDDAGFTLAQAKAGLAKHFGVPAGSIEIVIRG